MIAVAMVRVPPTTYVGQGSPTARAAAALSLHCEVNLILVEICSSHNVLRIYHTRNLRHSSTDCRRTRELSCTGAAMDPANADRNPCYPCQLQRPALTRAGPTTSGMLTERAAGVECSAMVGPRVFHLNCR